MQVQNEVAQDTLGLFNTYKMLNQVFRQFRITINVPSMEEKREGKCRLSPHALVWAVEVEEVYVLI